MGETVRAEPITGLCAHCRKVTVTLSEDCIQRARICNHELKQRGQSILGKNEVALCEDCYRKWQVERRAVGEQTEARMNCDWERWKATAKERGIDQADAELPDEWRHDLSFRERKEKWIARWSQQSSKRGAREALA